MSPKVTASAICMLFLMCSLQGASHVVSPGEKIQVAIDRANPGEVIEVRNGTYYENLNITKPIILRGLDGPAVNALKEGSGMVLTAEGAHVEGFVIINASQNGQAGIKVLSDNNTLKENTISRCFEGILLDGACYNNITNNNLSNNIDDGIDLERGSCHNIVSQNLLANNGDDGIDLDENSNFNHILKNTACNNNYGISLDDGADSNIIDGNSVINNVFGIELYLSKNNILRNNNFSGNRYGFEALDEHRISHNMVFPSNLIDGKPIYYLVEASDMIIDSASNAALVYCLDCKNITVRDLIIANTSIGINLNNVTEALLYNNSMHACEEDGIHISHCHNCLLRNNNISGNDNDGIHLLDSNNVTFYRNDISNNGYDGLDTNSSSLALLENKINFNQNSGIALNNAENCTIYANEIRGNDLDGLSMEGCRQIIIERNAAGKNARNGISLKGSKNLSLRDNEIDSNGMAGIELRSSMENVVANNTIIRNEFGISLYTSDGNLLLDNSGNENLDGIHLYQSSNNYIAGNNLTDNDLNGIYIGVLCQADTVMGNNIYGGRDGLCVQGSSNITLIKNLLTAVLHEGICLDETRDGKIIGNTITHSEEDGLHLSKSNACLVAGNNVSKSCYGIRLESSHDNTLFLNSLKDNRDHDAYDDGINLWDNEEMGNYYASYALSPGGCAPSGDMCTKTYRIPGGQSMDRHPLAKEVTGV